MSHDNITEVSVTYQNTREDDERGEWPRFALTATAVVNDGDDPDAVTNDLQAYCKNHVDKQFVAREFEEQVESEIVATISEMDAEEFQELADAVLEAETEEDVDMDLDL